MSRLEAVTSFCAIFVATIALAVAIFEAKVVREHQQLSVWPYLTFYSTSIAELNGKPLPLAMYLKNEGIGPAKVKYVKYFLEGKEYTESEEVFKQILPDYTEGSLHSDYEVMKVMLPNKEHLILGAFTRPQETKNFFEQVRAKKLNIEICYCSLYEQCWILHGKNEHKDVNRCD